VLVVTYGQFHDGSFNGLRIRQNTVDVFLSTDQKESFMLSAIHVAALRSDGLQAGNIIFDVECRSSEEITLADIRDVYRFETNPRDEVHATNALEKARREELSLLAIGPTYGGDCLVLAKSFKLLTESEWIQSLLETSPS
jgi:hypothetical protein